MTKFEFEHAAWELTEEEVAEIQFILSTMRRLETSAKMTGGAVSMHAALEAGAIQMRLDGFYKRVAERLGLALAHLNGGIGWTVGVPPQGETKLLGCQMRKVV